MANESLNFTINLNGNAYKGILQIDDSLKGVLNSVDSARSAFKKLRDASVRFDSITSTIQNLQSAIGGITQAGADEPKNALWRKCRSRK